MIMPWQLKDLSADYAQRANEGLCAFYKQEIPKVLDARLHGYKRFTPSIEPAFQAALEKRFAHTPEDYIAGGFLQGIASLYNQEDMKLIEKTCADFERVRLGFAYFSAISPTMRPLASMQIAHDLQLRTGWQKLPGWSIDLTQDLDNHHMGCEILAMMLYPDDPEIGLIRMTTRHHDSGEPVIGDFTPKCPISKQEKVDIERLGVRLVTLTAMARGNPIATFMHDAFAIYEGDIPEYADIAAKVKECDLLDMPVEVTRIIALEDNPQKREAYKGELDAFWSYVEAKLQTDRAKLFLEGLALNRENRAMATTQKLDEAQKYMCGHIKNGQALRQIYVEKFQSGVFDMHEAKGRISPLTTPLMI